MQHNATMENEAQIEKKGAYYDIEMILDKSFISSSQDIEPGKFISFSYIGQLQQGGAPINPKISCKLLFFFFFFF